MDCDFCIEVQMADPPFYALEKKHKSESENIFYNLNWIAIWDRGSDGIHNFLKVTNVQHLQPFNRLITSFHAKFLAALVALDHTPVSD